jgi:ATP-dependent DNA helicase RecG
VVRAALEAFLEEVEDPLPEGLRTRAGRMPLADALRQVHFPETLADAERARERLAFDELLLIQIMLARARQQRAAEPGIAFSGGEALTGPLLASLPYALTGAQGRAFAEIVADMRRPHPMNRLLQGDVGSGKTVVALLAALVAVADGYQAAIMAPTEILAEQHLSNLRALAAPLGVSVRLLVGRMPTAERRRASAEVASGAASIAVGTHALLSEDVRFGRLGLVVIDEQHRFGVFQRAGLRDKGVTPDTLVMTATPIPRTLTLTLYGDLEVSVLDELPPGRTPVRTAWRTADRRPAILQFVRDEVGRGRQAYVVYPLVEASEKSDLKAATEAYEALRTGPLSGLRLALLHGQMKGEQKEAAMSAFQRGEADVLVSTTVIEVGVDVPNASVMVVEHAERFGLPQLHQLRGRVGRGAHASTCVLIADPPGDAPFSEEARARLEALVRTNDGFEVAEIDLRLRGPGDLFGARQSGLPDLRIAHPVQDARLLNEARQAASERVEADPDLSAPEHRLLRERVDLHQRQRVDLAGVG